VLSLHKEFAHPHDETLLGQTKRLMSRAGLDWKDLDAVAVASGPGRFTGIRIGMAFASVLAQRSRKPALAISRFQALAAKSELGLVCAILPGYREETFYQMFKCTSGKVVPAAAPVWATAPEWTQIQPDILRQGAALVQDEVRAADLLVCAERMLKAKRKPRFEPLYLKPASYESKNKAGTCGI
jgi:tRNA threonylcarbamoyladenosine biosynthesis protein TsaB